jgi:hypothetical protein
MFCPECGLDYEEGMTHCLDCDLPLITEPEDEAGEEAEFLPFIEVTDAGAFALVTSYLEQAGVAWFVQSEPPLGALSDPGGTTAVIYVAENHLDPARKALESANLTVVG